MKVSIIDWIIKKLKRCIAIVEEGNTASQAIGSGKYVMWKGSLYTADTAISSGTTLAASGGSKNLTAVPDGGYNDLNGKISTLNSKTTWEDVDFTLGSGVASGTFRIRKMNKLVNIYGAVTLTGHTQWTDYLLADLSAQNIKAYIDWVEAVGIASANGACVNIELRTDGKLYARILGATLADDNVRFNIVCSIA